MSLFGRWVRINDTHECSLPTPRRKAGKGSVWECRCGRRWVLAYRENVDYLIRYRWEPEVAS